MQIAELMIDNFMTVQHTETTLANRGLVLIRGVNDDEDTFESNGAGKSTIFSEAIAWALFGETIRGYKGDKVVNRFVGKNTRVSLTILDGAEEYKIHRHRKHKDFKNNVLLFHNGENITGRSDTETNAMIEHLIELDFISFTNSILFGQGISKMFSSATDGEQKKILEQMLRIDIFRACQEKAKEHLVRIDKERDNTRVELHAQTERREYLQSTVYELQQKEAKLEGEVQAKIAELEDELKQHRHEMWLLSDTKPMEAERDNFRALRTKLDEKIVGYKPIEDEAKSLQSDVDYLDRQIKLTTKQLSESERKLQDVRAGKNIPEVCDACGQALPLNDTSAIEKHLEDDISKRKEDLAGLVKESKEARDLLISVGQHLEGKKALEGQRQELTDAINEVSTEISQQETQLRMTARIVERIEKQVEEQGALLNTTYTDIIESTIRDIGIVEGFIEESKSSIVALNKNYDLYNFWVNAFGNTGIKSVLLDSVTPYLNKQANYYLSQLAGSSIEVKFNTQSETKKGEKRDKFSVEVINANGDDDYKGNSNGERRRVDLAVNLALQDLVSSRSSKAMDLIVYDECFEGLDSVGCHNVISLLEEKSKTVGTIMVITHNDSLKELFTKSVTVHKQDKKTVIMEDAV